MVERLVSGAGRKQDAAPQPQFLGVTDLLHGGIDVVDVEDANTRAAPRTGVAKISEPAVVGAVALQILPRIDGVAVLHQAGAEGRHLREDDLPHDAVLLEF